MKIGFIHTKFQLMVIGFGLSIGLICTALLYGSMRYFFAQSHKVLEGAGIPPNHAAFFFLDQQELVMKSVSGLVVLVAIVASVIVGWLLSNRVARPLKQMQEHFEGVTAGQMPTRLHFRKYDFFQEVADAYNKELEHVGLLPKEKRERA